MPQLKNSEPIFLLGSTSAFLKPQVSSPKPFVVENTGIEPVTSWLQTRRSPS